jgi:hypothetical protein
MKQARMLKIRQWLLDYKKTTKCSKCTESDHRVLEFHHRNQNDKDGLISKKASSGNWSIKKIQSEITKCDVVCANCHRKIHYDNRGKRGCQKVTPETP